MRSAATNRYGSSCLHNTCLGGSGGESDDWYALGIQQFLETAAQQLGERSTEQRLRARPLLALPPAGSERGGGDPAEICRRILRDLEDFVRTRDIDVAFVHNKAETYAAAQFVRLSEPSLASWSLSSELRELGDQLAEYARSGSLSLFVGAGVSKSAGLPSWEGLLRQLAGECDLPEDVHAFGYLNRATLIRTAYERARGEGTFRRRIADFLRASHHTLAHSLLASIGAREMVTTNYDELLELAWLGLGPENALRFCRGKWRALGIHGC